MISGVPAPINHAIPPHYSHVRQNGEIPEHAGALLMPQVERSQGGLSSLVRSGAMVVAAAPSADSTDGRGPGRD